MQFAVIGAAGKAGRLITAEAISRGHEVTAIIRPGSEDRAPAGAKILAKSLFDLTAADLEGFEAVVSAFGTGRAPEEAARHVDAAQHLAEIFKAIPQVRLLMVGYMRGKDSIDALVDVTAAAFRLIGHTRFDHNAVIILHELNAVSADILAGLLEQ